MRKKIILIIIVILVVLLVVAGVFFKVPFLTRQVRWQAVYLNNGQTYFGHVRAITPDTITLSDVYYFDVYSVQSPAAPQTIYNLIKRGSDSNFATDGTLFINRTAVLYWENLNPDAAVVKNIEAVIQEVK